jgi:vancomycin resistance protein VanJ
LQLTIGEHFIVVAWLNNGAYLLWAGAIVLIVPCILFRRPRIIALMILPALVFTANYLPMYFPRDVDPPPNSEQFTLLTYNINLAPPDIHSIADDIRNIDADIVAIQELTPRSADVLETALSTEYPYRAFHAVVGFHGQGILSKYPIVSDEFWKIYLGHQRTGIAVNGTVITVYNVHPVHHILPFWGFDISRRTEEVNVFLNKASQDDTPILITGDFNMTDQSGDYQRITQTYQDSYRQVGYGMGTTFPAHIPFLPSLVRIDYVFHSEEFTAFEADVLRSTGGSDHRPLVVTLALDPSNNN